MFAARFVGGLFPAVNPRQLRAIELNKYAHELAQMTVWIGYLQWRKGNGLGDPEEPILQRMTTFENKDAVLDLQPDLVVVEPEWPEAEFIVSNPPFLGGKKLRDSLGDEYVEGLFTLWGERVPPQADYCCYWFEKARAQIEAGKTRRAGLLATQGIRGGANRVVLERIKQSGDIYFAISSREWMLEGANVHVSMVGFDNGEQRERTLDGAHVPAINADLTTTIDLTKAKRLKAARGTSFMADTKGGAFDIRPELAAEWLQQPNPHGRPNSDVLRPWANGFDVIRRDRGMWIIDFPPGTEQSEAAKYERPFEHLRKHVYPARQKNRRPAYAARWWMHVEPRPEMRRALAGLPRFLATLTLAKHRVFVWLQPPTLPDHQLIVFANADDAVFGILQSRVHVVWSLRKGTRQETRPRYTPTSTFETFPFPDLSGDRIGTVARELHKLRSQWLYPPEWVREDVWTFPASPDGPWHASEGRYSRMVPIDEQAEKPLKKRTLTALYNDSPSWLRELHDQLDRAVLDAYQLPADSSDEAILAHLLALNLERER